MSRLELLQKFDELHIPRDMYCLDGGLPNEAYCIGFYAGVWEVYYSERGHKSDLRTFVHETDAYQYLYDEVVSTANDMGLI